MDRYCSVRRCYRPRSVTLALIAFFTCYKLYHIPSPTVYDSDAKDDDHHNIQAMNIDNRKEAVPKEAEVPKHKLAVLVPFRNCYEELMDFVPHVHKFLNTQGIDHKIYVINQLDTFRFNRGSLINIGYLESMSECDYVVLHDVDLLPLNNNLSYAYPEQRPMHLSPPELHPRYTYKKFMGGVLLVNNKHFEMLNGLSNKYWGWGKEDDEFGIRMKSANLTPSIPQDITTGKRYTFRHTHDGNKRPRDRRNYLGQEKIAFKRDFTTGFNNTLYKVKRRTSMHIQDAPLVIIDVQLKCNLTSTPWCVTLEQYEAVQHHLSKRKIKLSSNKKELKLSDKNELKLSNKNEIKLFNKNEVKLFNKKEVQLPIKKEVQLSEDKVNKTIENKFNNILKQLDLKNFIFEDPS